MVGMPSGQFNVNSFAPHESRVGGTNPETGPISYPGGSMNIFGVGDDTGFWKAETLTSIYGTLIIDNAGNWQYYASNGNPNMDALNDGESVVDQFDVTYFSASGGPVSGTQTLSATTFGNTDVCFARGTTVTTALGDVAVEYLKAGDLVLTRDRGLQPVRWVGGYTVPADKMNAEDGLRPVRIKAGALGDGLPERDLLVSPQHRMMLKGQEVQLMFGHAEVLAAAKFLINDDTIAYADDIEEVEYFHILFDHHEVIMAHGAPTESFHPGEVGLSSLEEHFREQIFELFPILRINPNVYGAAARYSLKEFEASVLTLPGSRPSIDFAQSDGDAHWLRA